MYVCMIWCVYVCMYVCMQNMHLSSANVCMLRLYSYVTYKIIVHNWFFTYYFGWRTEFLLSLIWVPTQRLCFSVLFEDVEVTPCRISKKKIISGKLFQHLCSVLILYQLEFWFNKLHIGHCTSLKNQRKALNTVWTHIPQ